MKFEKIDNWGFNIKKPWIIAGPCSAETEEQLYDTSVRLKAMGIEMIRTGIWKPRTRPNNFEGVGKEALAWVQRIKKETGLFFTTEVGSPLHVEQALKAGIDMIWVGARTTANPFAVQEITEALRGANIPVLIKNPVNPDFALWLGAVERIYNVGVKKLGIIHRGFSSYQKSIYRNLPIWQIPLEMKRVLPDIPLICDSSHICGARDLIFDVSQKAMNLDYDGLMIEAHREPDIAWSDAAQQVTPKMLENILKNLVYRQSTSSNREYLEHIDELRNKIDVTDKELLELLARRMNIVKEIALYKRRNNVTVFQKNRWREITISRHRWAKKFGLNPDLMVDLFKLVHDASIRFQEQIMKGNNDKKTK